MIPCSFCISVLGKSFQRWEHWVRVLVQEGQLLVVWVGLLGRELAV